MGEVYRAKDTKLDRDVAIKIVPESFAHDPERIARFEREAKVLAALNHPNIAQIYGLEERALVMELVEGPTLAERIAKGALPLEEALGIAKQIAEALEAAHEKGITHRDLKPANVKVTPEGTVKVLDFGLATAAKASTADGNPSDSPTLTLDYGATRTGMILGTAAYMSPEQAVGKPVDRRGDIWSFGVVLFEMLTGRRLFEGETISHVLADVIKGEIDLSKLPSSTPNAIRDLLKRCLDRDLKNRLQWIGEARIVIDHSGKEPQATATTTKVPQRRILPWAVAAGLAMVSIGLGALLWRAPQPVEQPLKPLVRLDVDLGPDVSLGSQGTDVILSPDGTRLAYVSQNRLFTRRLDQPKAIELAGAEGAFAPFFSPDGQWVAFFAQGKLKKTSVEGGTPITVCNAPNAQGGSWGEDGNIVAALAGNSGLSRVASFGGTPAPLTELGQGEITHRSPQVLPGGKAVLFTANRVAATFDGADIEVISLADRRTKTLVRGGTSGRYLPSGRLVYINNGTLFAVQFAPDQMEVRGTPTPLLEQVAYSSSNGFAQFDFSRSGTLVYRQGLGGGGMVTIQWLEGGHKIQSLLAKPGYYMRPRVSPDGQLLAMDIAEGSDSDVWVYDWQRDTMTRLTFGGGKGFVEPVWSPDGRYIVGKTNEGSMAWIRADGAGKPQSLTESKSPQFPWSFSPDGKRLAYQGTSAANQIEVWTLPVESNGFGLRAGKPEPFLQSPFEERQPAFSPDGRWLAYASNESGVFQVYVRAFPDKGGKWQFSNTGGAFPEWARNGRELFFRTLDNRIMVANYTVKGDSFVADKPRVWSEKQLADFGPYVPNYDLAPDGKRIAALLRVEAPETQKVQNHVIFLENFFDELRRRVPASK